MKIATTHTGPNARFFGVCQNATTRVIHQFAGGPSRCGSSRRNLLVRLKDAQTADQSRFCEKCFPAGKPAAFYEADV